MNEPCEHDRIQSWHLEDGKSASFWSCVDCRTKFLPITQAWEEKRQAVQRCAEIADHYAGNSNSPMNFAENVAKAIKREFPKAFK